MGTNERGRSSFTTESPKGYRPAMPPRCRPILSLPFFSLALLACSTEPPSPPSPAPSVSKVPGVFDTSRASNMPGTFAAGVLWRDADARQLTSRIRDGLLSADGATRAAATLAVARLHLPSASGLLRDGLRDPEAAVRGAASLGLGALEDQAPDTSAPALLGALAVEREVGLRAAMLWDLGRIASATEVPALSAALASADLQEREGACRGLGALGLRGRGVDSATLGAIAARVGEDRSTPVRIACAFALTRLRPPEAGDAALAAGIATYVSRATKDPDPELREIALRVLGRYPAAPLNIIAERTADADWRVALQAFRTLAKRSTTSSDGAYAQALTARLDMAVTAPGFFEGPGTHVLIGALEAASPFAGGVAVYPLATVAFERLNQATSTTVSRATRGRGLAHCAAAKLVDLGRRWPSRIERCGFGAVSATERAIASTEVLAAVEGAHAQRVAMLARLYDGGDGRVKQAVLAALATLDDPGAARLLLRGLKDLDIGVITAALDAAVARGARLVAQSPGATLPPGTPSGPGITTATLTRAELEPALQEAFARLDASDEVEGLQSWIAAVKTLRAPRFAPELGRLGRHSNPTVRAKALDALEAFEPSERPAATFAPVPNPIDQASLDAVPAKPRVRVTTSRGVFVLELDRAEAPTTTARFLALVRRGFYDNLTFHRVVPGFVVQGGDPRGDGYGGAGYTQRCEDNRLRYVRGTLGMALAGRDTGGSQFFITQTVQPHLDGRYTAFGRVIEGLDVVDALLPADTMRMTLIE